MLLKSLATENYQNIDVLNTTQFIGTGLNFRYLKVNNQNLKIDRSLPFFLTFVCQQ